MMILGLVLLVDQASAQETSVLKTEREKASYAFGVDMAGNFKRQGIEVDLDLFIKGLQDGLSGGKLLMSDDDLRKTIILFHSALRRKQAEMKRKQAQISPAAEENKKAGEAFLTENKTKEGVVTLPSGLQYKILKAGEGKKPTDSDIVEVNYRGTFIDGTEFDSSYGRKQPATFKVSGVIPGWKEALKLMSVGSKWQIFVPSQLAYGERGAGSKIGPNATLIFEIELISIK